MKLLAKVLPLSLLLSAGIARAEGPSNADVQKWLAFFDKVVDTVVADQDNCPKMSGDINKLIDANQDLLAMAKKAKAEGKTLSDDARKHMEEGAKKMVPAIIKKCKDDKDVQAAFKRLDFGPRAQK